MASSSNRFEVPRADRPQSEAQETQIRVTDTDNTVRVPADSVESMASRAANRVDELQQENSSTLELGPNPFAGPSRGRRQRTPPFKEEEDEEPSKRQRLWSIPPIPTVREPTATLPSSESVRETRDWSDSGADKSDEPPPMQGPHFLSRPSSLDWAEVENPETPVYCMAQVNNESLIGSFSTRTRKCALKLGIDAGPRFSPTLTMEFFCNGSSKPLSGYTRWGLSTFTGDDFTVSEIKFHRVADCLGFGNIAHPDVLAACYEEQKNRLVCVRLKARPELRSCAIQTQQGYNDSIKKFLYTLFRDHRPYDLNIWFIAPYDLDRLERACLSFFLLGLESREPA